MSKLQTTHIFKASTGTKEANSNVASTKSLSELGWTWLHFQLSFVIAFIYCCCYGFHAPWWVPPTWALIATNRSSLATPITHGHTKVSFSQLYGVACVRKKRHFRSHACKAQVKAELLHRLKCKCTVCVPSDGRWEGWLKCVLGRQ